MTAIVGGTGLDKIAGLEIVGREVVYTAYGEPSAPVMHGRLAGVDVAFLPRHGRGHTIPPHLINYQANMVALAHLGIRRVIAINAVGAIDPELAVPQLVCPDQLIDYTFGRAHSFEGAHRRMVRHVDFTQPYSAPLRSAVLSAAVAADLPMRDGGVYGITQGPRLETAAEIVRMARDGCHVVGMTGMPEAALARELDLAYASCAVTINRAAGCGDLNPENEIRHNLEPAMRLVHQLLARLVPSLAGVQ